MGFFYGEKAFHAGKKSGKMTLPPQKNMPVTPLAKTARFDSAKYKFFGLMPSNSQKFKALQSHGSKERNKIIASMDAPKALGRCFSFQVGHLYNCFLE